MAKNKAVGEILLVDGRIDMVEPVGDMRRLCLIAVIFLMAGCVIGVGHVWSYDTEWEPRPIKSDEVYIAGNFVATPLGKIILVRKSTEYCAIKYYDLRTNSEGKKHYASYESYYQGDGTGDFSKKNMTHRKDTTSFLGPSLFYGLWHSERGDLNVKCGPIRLRWGGGNVHGGVHFHGTGMGEAYQYAIELAPTPWTDIAEVNVHDPRIWWYRYNTRRWNLYIPLSELWNLPRKPDKTRYEEKTNEDGK